MTRRLVLASASPARRYLLESAGLHPEVEISNVSEDGVEHLPASEAVATLAERKARAVLDRLTIHGAAPDDAPLIIACDSMLEFERESWSKAPSPKEAANRWRRLRGHSGLLHTGHVLIDARDRTQVGQVDTAVVHFGQPTDAEIDAYSHTPEALEVAGPFTLEGRSAPWIDSIEGNFGTITGLSLAVLRHLLRQLDVEIIHLWH